MIRAEAVRTLSRDDGGVDASARLGLVEVLLVSDDAVDCARRCLEWLGRHAHLRAGLCLLATQDDAARLTAVASHGLAADPAFHCFPLPGPLAGQMKTLIVCCRR